MSRIIYNRHHGEEDGVIHQKRKGGRKGGREAHVGDAFRPDDVDVCRPLAAVAIRDAVAVGEKRGGVPGLGTHRPEGVAALESCAPAEISGADPVVERDVVVVDLRQQQGEQEVRPGWGWRTALCIMG